MFPAIAVSGNLTTAQLLDSIRFRQPAPDAAVGTV